MNWDFARSESFICVNKFDICQCTCQLSRQIGYSVALRGKHDLKYRSIVHTPKFSFWIVSFCSLYTLFKPHRMYDEHTNTVTHNLTLFNFSRTLQSVGVNANLANFILCFCWLVFYSNLYKNNSNNITLRHVTSACTAPLLLVYQPGQPHNHVHDSLLASFSSWN